MKNLTSVKKHFLMKALIFLGVCTTGLMASCAKYGVLVPTIYMNIKGTIRSKESSQVIKGIQVEVSNSLSDSKALTDNNGIFMINPDIEEHENMLNLRISDIDSTINGSYRSKDTLIALSPDEKLSQVKENIEISLESNE